MKNCTIYHNPRCSKSREALALLNEKGGKITVIDYVKHPLTFEQLKALSAHVVFGEFVRTNEQAFKALALSLDDHDAVLKAMEKEPKLMQRPIVVCEGQTVIGRPLERILALLT